MTEEVKIDGRTRGATRQTDEPTRADKVAAQRRRRSDNLGNRMNLALTGVTLDRENYEYRIINDDDKNRLHRQTVEDDWDICLKDGSGVTFENATETELGAAHSRVVGTKKDGSPVRAYLCRKPKELFQRDRAEKQRVLDELDAAIRGGMFDPKGELRKAGGQFYNPGDRPNTVR